MNKKIPNKIISGILFVAVVGAIAALIYSVATPFKEPFTEFYLLNIDGTANNYPTELGVSEEGEVIIGIVNREYRPMNYRVEMEAEGSPGREIARVNLEHEGKWEETVAFTLNKPGEQQEVVFLLYDQDKKDPVLDIFLVVDVE